MRSAEEFLRTVGESAENVDAEKSLEAALADMEAGLNGGDSALPMIPSYLYEPEGEIPAASGKRIVIDAGGTNFRSALGYFDEDGKAVFEKLEKTKMPASDRALSADEFYGAIAENVSRLAEEGGDVGFCFSYQVEMGENGDGIVADFSKEIKAPEVVGTRVGERTLEALRRYGDKPRKIVILNDTVATLLGGMAGAKKKYSGYIGYIYGTGTNLCYTEAAEKIKKVSVSSKRRMIINTECGNFRGFARGTYDKTLAEGTTNPSASQLEKATSGKYLATLMSLCLRAAQERGILGGKELPSFELRDVTEFLEGAENVISGAFAEAADRAFVRELFLALIERAAKLGAIVNAAAAIRCGTRGGDPVAIVAEGTTFDRLYGFRDRFAFWLEKILLPRGYTFEILRGEELNLTGTLYASLAGR